MWLIQMYTALEPLAFPLSLKKSLGTGRGETELGGKLVLTEKPSRQFSPQFLLWAHVTMSASRQIDAKVECIHDKSVYFSLSFQTRLFPRQMATGWPESCRAVSNCLMFFQKGPDDLNIATKRSSRLGSTPTILLSTSSCREAAIPGTDSLDM